VQGLNHYHGEEHDVYHDPVTNRAVKTTKSRAFAGGGVGGYLERLAKVNGLFGDDFKVEGWLDRCRRQPRAGDLAAMGCGPGFDHCRD